jgi:hypothetical protein
MFILNQEAIMEFIFWFGMIGIAGMIIFTIHDFWQLSKRKDEPNRCPWDGY